MSRDVEDRNRHMLRARDAMDHDFAKPLDIPALARIALVSEAHFIRTFKATFGETPHRYLQRRRIERAMFMLRESDRPVTEICFEVGFASLGSFGRTFRAIVGLSPTEYRQRRPDFRKVPNCFVKGWVRPSSFGVAPRPGRDQPRCMLTSINISSVFVLDQDQALDFYVGKLGLEVNADFDLGFMRWLTVRVPGDSSREILLEMPGPPGQDPATGEQVREILSKGGTGFAVGFTVDDAQAEYERLAALDDIDFTDPPTERFYGIDFGLRDPFGNNIRIVQMVQGEVEYPGAGATTPAGPTT